jgi:flavodoxin
MMTPEQEKELALNILRSLFGFHGYIRSIHIHFDGDNDLPIKWKPWIEDMSRGTQSTKVFTHMATGRRKEISPFIHSYEEAIQLLAHQIGETCTIFQQDADMLKNIRSDATYIAIPNVNYIEEVEEYHRSVL